MGSPLHTIGLGLASMLLVAGCARAGGEPAQFSVNGGLGLDAQQTITQTVNPAGDVLTGVDVQVLAVIHNGDGAVHLAITADQRTLDEVIIPVAELGEGWVSFPLDQPLAVPDVVSLAFSVSGEGTLLLAANSTPADTDPRVEPAHDPYPQGEGHHNGRPINGDLVFQLRGSQAPQAVGHQLIALAKEGGHRLRSQPTFTLIWGVALLAALLLIIAGLVLRTRQRHTARLSD